jgi:putative ABC transport system substrate-binding protein
MLLIAYRKKIPVLGLSERHAQMGALFSLSFASSEDIGRQAGELVQSILGGTRAAEIPYTTPRKLNLTVNLKTAGKLGIEIPKAILGRAATVIQ